MRDPDNMDILTDIVNPECQWVLDGEGLATMKYDGTCCAFIDGVYYKRRMVKKGKKPPDDFIPCSTDPNTGKTFGWIPVDANDPSNKYHIEALGRHLGHPKDGTYELVGPMIQSNLEKYPRHTLVPHSLAIIISDFPREKEAMIKIFKTMDIEGIVFHHKDGRMAKIKKGDFGLSRKPS